MNSLNAKTVYDEINRESGGVYYSYSQSGELRDTRHVHHQIEKENKENGMSTPELSQRLSAVIIPLRSSQVLIIYKNYFVYR